MLDQDEPSSGNGASRVHLSEAAQAVEDVLSGCRAELRFLRRRLKGREEPGEDTGEFEGETLPENREESFSEDPEDLSSPKEDALHIAARLEACAGALRNASSPGGPSSD